MAATPDTTELVTKVKQMYRDVAENPRGDFHFELGEQLALRVGYFFDLADLQVGETVLDLGSGSGMDAFYAAGLVGRAGRVIGVDFTPEQIDKARRLAGAAGLSQVEFHAARIESLPLPDEAPTSGRPASAAPPRSSSTSPPSRRPVSPSGRFGSTRTSSSPSRPATPARRTA